MSRTDIDVTKLNEAVREEARLVQAAVDEVRKVIVGQKALVERMMVALLCRGHLLVEGVPGLAKTLAVKTLGQVLDLQFARIQFTPDLLPADLVGTRIFNQRSGEFSTWLGPVFTNLLLADEINRSPAKVQSALLEVMQERQVSIGGQTHKVPEPFLVMATQNPIETEGTYPLPEAQVDRFMMKVLVDYPSELEEFVIVERMTGRLAEVRQVVTVEQLIALRGEADAVYVDPSLIEYAVRLATATRRPDGCGLPDLAKYITYGASPRASINLILTARALAFVRGRGYAVPQDVSDMALDVMRHRLVLSYEALSDGVTADAILRHILGAVPTPAVPMQTSVAEAGDGAAAAQAQVNVTAGKES
jgi:MoxR-like ATPase